MLKLKSLENIILLITYYSHEVTSFCPVHGPHVNLKTSCDNCEKGNEASEGMNMPALNPGQAPPKLQNRGQRPLEMDQT